MKKIYQWLKRVELVCSEVWSKKGIWILLMGLLAVALIVGGSRGWFSREIVIVNPSPSPTASVLRVEREVTAYTLGRIEETDNSPCVGAYNDDLCKLAKRGINICASNEFPKGTILVKEA